MWMASPRALITIFVSLEVVTMAFYILVTYMRRNVGSLEAGVKYLILGALSTGFLVYGITWTFGVTGEFKLDAIAVALNSGEVAAAPALFAFGLLMVGLAFKIAAVPFQIWVPDVYQGAPMPVTAFLSVGSKAAGFIVLTRLLEPFLAAAAIRTSVISVLVIIDNPRGDTYGGGSVAAPVFAEIASYTARQLRVAPVAGEQVDAGPVRAPVSTLPVASDDEQTGED